MDKKIKLIPGICDTKNRHYLPEKLLDGKTTVNENGNNSIVYPEHLQEFHGVVADGLEDEWYEYVPESYDPSRPVPLVIGLHGGLMTGWGHAIYTSWTLVADREGFICLFPNAHEKRMWTVEGVFETFRQEDAPDLPIVLPPENMDDNHDIKMIQALIARMEEKYNIDKGRIFMQGMSMGNIMTGQFARNYGRILAGAAGSGGPCEPFNLYDESGKIKNKEGHMAIRKARQGKKNISKNQTDTYYFDVEKCKICPQKEGCYKDGDKSKTYSVTIKSDIHKSQIAFQESEYFKEKSKERYKIEAKNSELKHRHGYDKASSSGLIGMEI